MKPWEIRRRFGTTAAPPGAVYRSRLRFGGADASTAFVDDFTPIWSAHNGAEIDTSLGDQRGLFSGGANIRTAAPALAFGTADFKIAFILRFNNKAGYQTIVSRGYTGGGVAGQWLVQTGNGDGLLNFYWSPTTTGATLVAAETSGTINNNQDYLIEIERAGGTLNIKRDGSTVASGADTNDYTPFANFQIGAGSSVSDTAFPFNGWIKDFRVT